MFFVTGVDTDNAFKIELESSPEEQAQNLIDDIENLGFPNNVEKSLLGPLKKIIKVLEDNNPKNDGSVCGKLDEFIQTVNEKEESEKLGETDAEELRTAAEAIKTSLECV